MLMCPHPFAVGDVTVDYNDFRVSNPVKLEGWKVGFRMSVKDSVGQSTATLKVRLLGDLHAPHLFPDDLLVNGHPTLTQDPASISGSATLASNPDLGCDSGSAVLDPSKVNVTAFVDMERDPAHRLKWKISVGGQVGNCAADWSVSEDSGAYATVHDDLSVAAGQYTDPAEGGVHLEWDAFTPEVPMDPHAPR